MIPDPARSAALLALVAGLVVCFFGFRMVAQDLAYTRAQTELSFWGRGDYRPTQSAVDETGQTLQRLVREIPLHPEYLILQARYNAWQAYWSEDPQAREAFSRAAMHLQYRALESRPAHRHSWVTMIEYASRFREGEAMLQLAQTRLKLLQPPGDRASIVQEEKK